MARWTEHRPATAEHPALELVFSTQRRKTVTARSEAGRIVIQLPAHMSDVRREKVVADLVARVTGKQRAVKTSDADLMSRAEELADLYVDGVRPRSVSWSTRMRQRWGSCTIEEATIRLNHQLASFPPYVVDYVLVHELAHLIHRGHGPNFDAVVGRYPQSERARGFLEGVSFADSRYVPEPDDGGSD